MVWEEQANCSLAQELGNYLQYKYQTRIKGDGNPDDYYILYERS